MSQAPECSGVTHLPQNHLFSRFWALAALSEPRPGSAPGLAILWLCGLRQTTQCLLLPHRSALLFFLPGTAGKLGRLSLQEVYLPSSQIPDSEVPLEVEAKSSKEKSPEERKAWSI